MKKFRLISAKGNRDFHGTPTEAVQAAIEMNRDLQPAFGVTLCAENGDMLGEVMDENYESEMAIWNDESKRYELPYDDGIHMLQTYISDDGDNWNLIGYDGVLRYISDDDEFFENLTITFADGPRNCIEVS